MIKQTIENGTISYKPTKQEKEKYVPVYRCKLVREGKILGRPKMSSPITASQVCNDYLADSPCEQLVVAMLDTKLQVIGFSPITTGCLDCSLCHPREVFRNAILCNAASIIVAHNHPSGSLEFSNADSQVFNMLKNAGDILGIKLQDFIVVDGLGNSSSLMHK